jgi:hypothetical protein
MALRLKTNIVSFKNRLKTRVALIELLDLSGIAVGNVGVPTCLNLSFGFQAKYLNFPAAAEICFSIKIVPQILRQFFFYLDKKPKWLILGKF